MTHKFESAGLGLAPFRYVDFAEIPGGSCSYCGTGIRNQFMIQSSDGKRFVVGSECVRHTGDTGLIASVKRAATAAAKTATAARIAAVRARLAADPAIGATTPHPNASCAAFGRTFRDYAEWIFKNAGDTGKLKMAKQIEKMT